MRFWATALIGMMLATVAVAPSTATADETDDRLIFGIVPQQSASRTAELWVPLLDEIGKRLGIRIVFRTAPSIPEFEQRMLAGEYDLVYGSAYHYLAAKKRFPTQGIARERSDEQGILVVRADSHVQDLTDLQNGIIAFPAPNALGASLLMQARLRQDKITFDPKYVGSHDSVYRAVANGSAAAGGGVMRTFMGQDDALRNKLRIVFTSAPFASHPIFAAKPIRQKTLTHLQSILFSLDADPIGEQVLKQADLKGIALINERDYDQLAAQIDEVGR